jgi:hypothetical protein
MALGIPAKTADPLEAGIKCGTAPQVRGLHERF